MSGQVVEGRWKRIDEHETFLNEFLIPAVTDQDRLSMQASKAENGGEMIGYHDIESQDYIRSLILLMIYYGKNLSLIECSYTLDDGTHVQLYDIKCKSMHEDAIIEKMYNSWDETVRNHMTTYGGLSSPALSSAAKDVSLEKKSKSPTTTIDTSLSSLSNPFPVCPFRRGMCVGKIGRKIIAVVGNIKFQFGTMNEICSVDNEKSKQNKGNSITTSDYTIALTEKANGEYTICTGANVYHNDDKKYKTWIIVGSKNVRFAAPIDLTGGDIDLPIRVFNSFMKVCKSDIPEVAANIEVANDGNIETSMIRYSYLKDMLQLWNTMISTQLIKEQSSKNNILWDLLLDSILVGEQVGVHSHIYTNYQNQEIRIFGVIEKKSIILSLGCDVISMSTFLHDRFEGLFKFVEIKKYNLSNADERESLVTELERIASASMEDVGEGVVVYKYINKPLEKEKINGENANGYNEVRELINIWKFKNEEYAFERRLRTLLTPIASTLSKSGMTMIEMNREMNRVENAMVGAISNSRKNKEKIKTSSTDQSDSKIIQTENDYFNDRIKLIPYIIVFLEKHQLTHLCKEFLDSYVYIIDECMKSKSKYEQRVNEIKKCNDKVKDKMEEMVKKYQSIIEKTKESELKTLNEVSNEIACAIKGKFPEYKAFGISAAPSSGKSSLMIMIKNVLRDKYNIDADIYDRDMYVINNEEGMHPEKISKMWINDIKNAIGSNLESSSSGNNEGTKQKVALIGNCFTGSSANRIEKQIDSKIYLGIQKETMEQLTRKKQSKKEQTPEFFRSLRFQLLCIERLLQRTNMNDSRSTLTMNLGGKIVMDKYFSSFPDENMMKKRLATGSGFVFSSLRENDTIDDDDTNESSKSKRMKNDAAQSKLSNSNSVTDDDVMKKLLDDLLDLKQMVSNSNQQDKNKSGEEGEENKNASEVAKLQRREYTVIKMEVVKDITDTDRDKPLRIETPPSNLKCKYISINGTNESAYAIYRLGNGDIIRVKPHITLLFNPSKEDMVKATTLIENMLIEETKQNGKSEEESEITIVNQSKNKNEILFRLPIASIITVKTKNEKDKLQFGVVDMIHSKIGKRLSNELQTNSLHITLGSTDTEVLPHYYSGMIIKELLIECGNDLEFFASENEGITLQRPNKYSSATAAGSSSFKLTSNDLTDDNSNNMVNEIGKYHNNNHSNRNSDEDDELVIDIKPLEGDNRCMFVGYAAFNMI